ncbi:hypothetical protein KC19_5G202000 [Ceratodon purpureus]|uniref:Uncharacterized protein n=1 Tax=Ceratodon purpureus TaxID=3225 RepID=A0A8T0I4Q9_CERPU|nr:hypothetical protein KC19_5G202000 [Ceratodon purpureus]
MLVNCDRIVLICCVITVGTFDAFLRMPHLLEQHAWICPTDCTLVEEWFLIIGAGVKAIFFHSCE